MEYSRFFAYAFMVVVVYVVGGWRGGTASARLVVSLANWKSRLHIHLVLLWEL